MTNINNNIMESEKLIERNEKRIVDTEIAFVAIRLARKEMKEKAISAFTNFVEDYSHEAGFTEIKKESEHYIEVFTKMLEEKQ